MMRSRLGMICSFSRRDPRTTPEDQVMQGINYQLATCRKTDSHYRRISWKEGSIRNKFINSSSTSFNQKEELQFSLETTLAISNSQYTSSSMIMRMTTSREMKVLTSSLSTTA